MNSSAKKEGMSPSGSETKERVNLKAKAGDLQRSNQALEQVVEKKQLTIPGHKFHGIGV